MRGQEVDKFQQSTSSGLALRVLTDDRLGFAYVIGGDEAGIARAAQEAMASAAASDPEPGFTLAGPVERPPQVEVFDPALAEEPVEAKVAKAHELAAAALAADPRVVHVQPAEYGSAVSTERLISSTGLDFTHRGQPPSRPGPWPWPRPTASRRWAGTATAPAFWTRSTARPWAPRRGRRGGRLFGGPSVEGGRYPWCWSMTWPCSSWGFWPPRSPATACSRAAPSWPANRARR